MASNANFQISVRPVKVGSIDNARSTARAVELMTEPTVRKLSRASGPRTTSVLAQIEPARSTKAAMIPTMTTIPNSLLPPVKTRKTKDANAIRPPASGLPIRAANQPA